MNRQRCRRGPARRYSDSASEPSQHQRHIRGRTCSPAGRYISSTGDAPEPSGPTVRTGPSRGGGHS
eukprot:8881976-Pyramimonas_sp.AAC.1